MPTLGRTLPIAAVDMLSYIGTVERFSYHYHTVEHEPDLQSIRSRRGHHHWFNVRRDDGGADFRVVVRVSDVSAHVVGTGAEALAMELGTAHAKGLIDLGYVSGEEYEVTREGDSSTPRDDQVTDTELHLAILRALRRVRRAEDRTGAIDGLSIDGLSQVLGVSRTPPPSDTQPSKARSLSLRSGYESCRDTRPRLPTV
jgi:hypothetical protein